MRADRIATRLAILLIAAGGCHCGGSAPTGASTSGPGAKGTSETVPSTPPLASKAFYRVDLAGQPACTAGTPCEVQLALTALAGHHVNREYPTKFVPSPDELPVDGTATFTIEKATRGVMSIRVIAPSAGKFTLKGQFKLGVCTDDRCEIDAPTINVPITAS